MTYTLWTKPRHQWTELPIPVMTPELERAIKEALAKPDPEFEAMVRPFQQKRIYL